MSNSQSLLRLRTLRPQIKQQYIYVGTCNKLIMNKLIMLLQTGRDILGCHTTKMSTFFSRCNFFRYSFFFLASYVCTIFFSLPLSVVFLCHYLSNNGDRLKARRATEPNVTPPLMGTDNYFFGHLKFAQVPSR